MIDTPLGDRTGKKARRLEFQIRGASPPPTQKVHRGAGGGGGAEYADRRTRLSSRGRHARKKSKVWNKKRYSTLFQQSLAHMALQIPGASPHREAVYVAIRCGGVDD